MPIVVAGISHHTAPVTVREKFAFAESAIPQALQKLRDLQGVKEAVIISTCNRVEVYASSDLPQKEACRALQEFLLNFHGIATATEGEIYTYAEPKSIEHLFRVAAGLDSMVLGETEI